MTAWSRDLRAEQQELPAIAAESIGWQRSGWLCLMDVASFTMGLCRFSSVGRATAL
jgi:hypothetical protein